MTTRRTNATCEVPWAVRPGSTDRRTACRGARTRAADRRVGQAPSWAERSMPSMPGLLSCHRLRLLVHCSVRSQTHQTASRLGHQTVCARSASASRTPGGRGTLPGAGGLRVGLDRSPDLFSARRCRSKERVRSGSLGSDMAAPWHASLAVLRRYAGRLKTTRQEEPQVKSGFYGTWRSLVSAPALGAGGRRFKSGRPDHQHEPPAQQGCRRPLTRLTGAPCP